jgi:hypothetical protein
MALEINYAPASTYDLRSEVNAGENVEISHGNMQFKAKVENAIVPYQSFICKYHHVLNDYIVERELTEDEYMRYYQRPKLLSYDLYGTPELWSWLMYINNCKSVANFTYSHLKVFTSNIGTAITEILTMTGDDLKTNKSEVYTDE